MTTDELNVIIQALGTQQFRNQIQQCTASTMKFKAAIGLISAACYKFGKSALELASDLEEVQNVTDVTFENMSEAVNKFSKEAIQNYGISETLAKKYTGTFGAMAKSFGFTTEEALKMSTSLTAMSGDVASFYNLETDAAYTKLKSVFTGETESLKELGIVMTQTALDQWALAQGYGKTTKQMTEQEKVALRYKFVMDKLQSVSGDYQRTSDGWANMTRTAKLEIQSLAAEIGSELMPAAKVVFKVGVDGIKTILTYIKPVVHEVSSIVTSFASASAATKIFAVTAAGAVVVMANLNKIHAAAIALSGALSGALKVLSFSMVGATTSAQKLGVAVKGALGWIGLLLAALSVLSWLADDSDQVSESVDKASDSLNQFGNMAETATDGLEDMKDTVSDMSDATQEIDRFLSSFDEVNKVGGSSSILGGLVTDEDLLRIEDTLGVLDGFETAVDGIQAGLDGINFENPMQKSKGFVEEFKENWQLGISIIKGYIEQFRLKLIEICISAAAEVEKVTQKIRTAALLACTYIGYAWNIIGTVISVAKGQVENAFDVVEEGWNFIISLFKGDITSISVKLTSLISKIEKAVSSWKTLTGIASSNIGEKATSVISAISGAVAKKADGGYVSTGEMFIAREAGPEMVGRIGNKTAVANNDQITTAIAEAVRSAIGGGGNQQIVLKINDRVLGQAVVNHINNATMSCGQSPLIELGG